jgi:serine/threonine protein kinase
MRMQILDGLCYLNDIGLEHQSLTCRNILLGLDGVIKIGE